MTTLPRPVKPLKILTIDGGGLRGISTLLILDRLLKAIARHNKVPTQKPRPCDVFDVIAGIGAGGWLALLLGRFQMDVSAALAEWYNLVKCIQPKSKTEELRMRWSHHSYFDTDRLVEQVDQLTDFYETGKHMFFEPPQGTRCKHVFVAALDEASKGTDLHYTLFRTYECPKEANVLDGPLEPPRQYKISHAFGATGAAKYFTPPWKDPPSKKHKTRFLDIQFPKPHNITERALNEMWGLYGKDVGISVIVNIGPGMPNTHDLRQIARRFSWGSKASLTKEAQPKPGLLHGAQIITGPKIIPAIEHRSAEGTTNDTFKQGQRIKFDNEVSKSPGETGKKSPVARRSTFGSELNVSIEDKLKRDESKIEQDIKNKLKHVYQKDIPPYFRLAPESSAVGTAQNDTSSPKAAADGTNDYLSQPDIEGKMDEVSRSIGDELLVVTPVAAWSLVPTSC